METRTILVLLGLLVAPIATAGEAYVWTDDDGVVHYSDRPAPGARLVQLAEPNTGRSPARRRAAQESAAADAEAPADAGRLQLGHHGAQVANAEIDHPLLFRAAEIVGVLPKRREHGRPVEEGKIECAVFYRL